MGNFIEDFKRSDFYYKHRLWRYSSSNLTTWKLFKIAAIATFLYFYPEFLTGPIAWLIVLPAVTVLYIVVGFAFPILTGIPSFVALAGMWSDFFEALFDNPIATLTFQPHVKNYKFLAKGIYRFHQNVSEYHYLILLAVVVLLLIHYYKDSD